MHGQEFSAAVDLMQREYQSVDWFYMAQSSNACYCSTKDSLLYKRLLTSKLGFFYSMARNEYEGKDKPGERSFIYLNMFSLQVILSLKFETTERDGRRRNLEWVQHKTQIYYTESGRSSLWEIKDVDSVRGFEA